MKLIILLGALIGFSIGMFWGWANQSPWPSVMWRSCAAAYGAGLLMRWWGRMWVKSLYEAHTERRLAQLQQLAELQQEIPDSNE